MMEASPAPAVSLPPDTGEPANPSVLPLPRLVPPPPEGTFVVPPDQSDPRNRWFLVQLAADLRQAVQMYFDARYRVSRLTQFAFPFIGALMVLNYFVFTVWWAVPVVSPILERLLDVLLAVVAYRVLVRELDRYRAVLDYLARYGPR